MKRFLTLLCVLLLPLCAFAVSDVPESVTEIGSEAFAGTAIDALLLPASVAEVGGDILSGTGAAYLYLNNAETVLSAGAADDAAFVFAPADSPAASLPNFYPIEGLVEEGGLYYFAQDTALPLCAVDPAGLSGSVTIPKLLQGTIPVVSLDKLYLAGAHVAELRVPEYLTLPEGLDAVRYQTMTVQPPVPDVTESPAGQFVTWTTGATGACGDVSYIWAFDTGDSQDSLITAEPTVQYAPLTEGVCTVTVTAEDALGDSAAASGGAVTVTSPQPTYRALLIGNTYTGSTNQLDGPDNDIASMALMLDTMTGTPFQITRKTNRSATDMQLDIASAFAGAQASDVSLFYYSGHGSSAGALVGTGNTFLTIYSLRSTLQKIPGTKIILLDCCYSGSVIGKSLSSASVSDPALFNQAVISAFSAVSRSSENLADTGFIVLTACSKDQESFSLSSDGANHWGAFTYGVCYGSGYDIWNRAFLNRLPADSSGDGAITLGEAYAGAKERIDYLNTIKYFDQSVQFYGDTDYILWRK
ncbi:MAG: caspase family protein [Clostridia bacterium]|nr:caspase family protein [Clostridia bacterium]